MASPTITHGQMERVRDLIPALRAHLAICWAFTKAKYARSAFHKRRWAAHQHTLSDGFCRHTSLFVQRFLARKGLGKWRCAGGVILDPTGGRMGAHYWLEGEGMILDLTVDQFGLHAPMFCQSTSPLYLRHPTWCRQASISRLTAVVSQWEGECFAFWDWHGDIERIRASFFALSDGTPSWIIEA